MVIYVIVVFNLIFSTVAIVIILIMNQKYRYATEILYGSNTFSCQPTRLSTFRFEDIRYKCIRLSMKRFYFSATVGWILLTGINDKRWQPYYNNRYRDKSDTRCRGNRIVTNELWKFYRQNVIRQSVIYYICFW